MVGDHDLRFAHVVACTQHRALRGETAAPSRAGRGGCGDAHAQRRWHRFGRSIQVTVPLMLRVQLAQALGQSCIGSAEWLVVQRVFAFEQSVLHGFAQQFGHIARAQVTGAALGQCHGGFDSCRLEESGDVALHELRLQGDRAGADHQFFLAGQRDGHTSSQVGEALAHAGGRFHHAHATGNGQCARGNADHLALRATGAETGDVFLQPGVGGADVGLERFVQLAPCFNLFHPTACPPP